MNILPTVARLSLLALSLVACGGGSSPPTPQPTDPLLTETNAWKDAVPADAEIVSVDDFRKALASGDAVLAIASPAAMTGADLGNLCRVQNVEPAGRFNSGDEHCGHFLFPVHSMPHCILEASHARS